MSEEKDNIVKKDWTRSPALIKAQKKYMKKLKDKFPERYKEMLKKNAYKQYHKNKDKEDFKEKNRLGVKTYYYRNREAILERRRLYYQNNKEKFKKRYKYIKKKDRIKKVEENDIIEI